MEKVDQIIFDYFIEWFSLNNRWLSIHWLILPRMILNLSFVGGSDRVLDACICSGLSLSVEKLQSPWLQCKIVNASTTNVLVSLFLV